MPEIDESFEGSLVIVIDDEETQRLLTRDCLEESGFKVEEASDGVEGLALARQLQPDLILLDLMMPGIDGFEVCRQLRADSAISNIPVIVNTGRDDTEGVERGFAAGANDFLTKPIVWNLFPNRIRYVLRTSRMERDLRAAMEAAEVANEAKTNLLANMGHELRTPLNAIIGFAEIMLSAPYGPLGASQYRDYCGDIHNSGKQLLSAINDILDIVKSEAGETDPEIHEVDIGDLVNRLVTKFAEDAKARDIEVVNEMPRQAQIVHCDDRDVARALSNLMSNAVKFTEPGGQIRIEMEPLGNERVALVIHDNGIGISADDLPRVLKPFEQADSSLSRNYEGIGLGIPLSITLIRRSGGDIDFESTLGQGTTARIELPTSEKTEFGIFLPEKPAGGRGVLKPSFWHIINSSTGMTG